MVLLLHVQQTWVLVKDNQFLVNSQESQIMEKMRKNLKNLPSHLVFKPEEWEGNTHQWTVKVLQIFHQVQDSELKNLMLLENFMKDLLTFTTLNMKIKKDIKPKLSFYKIAERNI